MLRTQVSKTPYSLIFRVGHSGERLNPSKNKKLFTKTAPTAKGRQEDISVASEFLQSKSRKLQEVEIGRVFAVLITGNSLIQIRLCRGKVCD